MATTLFLVRHGAHDRVDGVLCGRMAGVHLSEAGLVQAGTLAEHFARRELQAVYSSPQSRARETAAPIAAASGCGTAETAALDEIDFGEWTGRGFASLADDARWQDWNAARSGAQPPGGESMAAVARRVTAWMEGLPRHHPDSAVAGVSHADVIKAALASLLGLSMDAHARFTIDPASVSAVALWPGGGKVMSMNEATVFGASLA